MGVSYDIGRKGEDISLKYFCNLGYYLLKRNFRVQSSNPLSEIDLIFLDMKGTAPVDRNDIFPLIGIEEPDLLYDFVVKQSSCLEIIFVEVKYWKAYPISDLCYNLSPARQQRMFNTADCFLQENPIYSHCPRRFDLAIVQNDNNIKHIKAAFP